ncbi:MAG TPA: hypothetical protein PL110_04025 [Candidatus Eremiobacteraeota bacterium]|nr:hypothetical protein [Candidatus Eremiobacteraeota bacterium]
MKYQCAWCLKVLNINTGKWEQGPALVLPDASHGCCPECEKKYYSYIEKVA